MAGAFPQREFGQLKGQARLAKIAAAKGGDYWSGSVWVGSVTLANVGTAGTITGFLVPGEDHEIELSTIQFINNDTTGRTCQSQFVDEIGGNPLYQLLNATVNPNGNFLTWPHVQELTAVGSGSSVTRMVIAGEMALRVAYISLGANANAQIGVMGRLRGELPTWSHEGPVNSTITVDTNRFF